jgi:hypothetical protein
MAFSFPRPALAAPCLAAALTLAAATVQAATKTYDLPDFGDMGALPAFEEAGTLLGVRLTVTAKAETNFKGTTSACEPFCFGDFFYDFFISPLSDIDSPVVTGVLSWSTFPASLPAAGEPFEHHDSYTGARTFDISALANPGIVDAAHGGFYASALTDDQGMFPTTWSVDYAVEYTYTPEGRSTEEPGLLAVPLPGTLPPLLGALACLAGLRRLGRRSRPARAALPTRTG